MKQKANSIAKKVYIDVELIFIKIIWNIHFVHTIVLLH